MFIHMNMHDIN